MQYVQRHFRQHTYSPTYREIMVAMRWKSPNASFYTVAALAEKGLIGFTPGKRRSLVLTKSGRKY